MTCGVGGRRVCTFDVFIVCAVLYAFAFVVMKIRHVCLLWQRTRVQ